MKKSLLLLLCLALLLTGCAGNGASGSTDPQEIVDIIPRAPENPQGSALLSYDPQRELYLTCKNWDRTIYLLDSAITNIEFYIYSKTPLDPKTITVDIPIENDYQISAVDFSNFKKIEDLDKETTGRPYRYYHYQCYRGMDWKKMAQLAMTADTDEAKAAAEEYANQYVADFQKLTVEDLPEFYEYAVFIQFATVNGVEESFRELDVTIDGTVYHQEIGQVTLIPAGFPLEYPIYWGDEVGFSGPGYQFLLYGDGLQDYRGYQFTVTEDTTLTKLYLLDDKAEILDIFVQKDSQDVNLSYYWDGNSPCELSAGDSVEITIIFRDERLTTLDYDVDYIWVLEFECGGVYSSRVSERSIKAYPDPYIFNAVVFDGLDLESYYRDFYYPLYEPWREEYQ